MQIGAVIIVLFVAALVLLWLLPRSEQLKRIFSDEHLIEIAEQMEVVRALAVSLADVAEELYGASLVDVARVVTWLGALPVAGGVVLLTALWLITTLMPRLTP